MNKTNNRFWLGLIALLIAGAIAWGALNNQQQVNCKQIERLGNVKVDNEVFLMHLEQARRQFDSIENSLATINMKLDKLYGRTD